MHAHRGQAFQGVTPSFHLSNYQLSKQLYFVVCPLTFYRQRTSRTRPELVPLFPLSLCVGYQGVDKFQNVALCLDVGHRVIVHTLSEVHRIEYLDFIALPLLQEMSHLGEDAAFRIYAHIRGMSLKELRGQPEPGLSRAGRTDNTAVEISGVGRDFGPGVHSQKFRPGQYHVVFKLRVYEWGYVFGRSP